MMKPETPIERRVWKKVREAQGQNRPVPVLSSEEAAALRTMNNRFVVAELEARARRRLPEARRWAYHNLPGFQRHHGLYHPDILAWAKAQGDQATDEEWIAAAKRAHIARPINISHCYNTEPVTAENAGRPRKIMPALANAE